MHNDPFYLLDPVFRFFDRLIDDEGDILYMLLVYASIPVLVWILRGGLRRKQTRQDSAVIIPVIVVQPAAQPPPLPPILGDYQQHERGNDEQSFAA